VSSPIMPGGNFLLGYAEYAEAVMRAFGLKGDLPRELQTTYGLGIQLLDLEGAEFQYLKRAVLWESGGTCNAVAAEFGIFALGGRAGATTRETLAVVEEVTISNIAAAVNTFSIGVDWYATATFAGGFNRTSYPRDDRAALVSTSAFATATDSDPATPMGSSHYVVTLPAGGIITLQGPWVISNKPNSAGTPSTFSVGAGVVNLAYRVGIKWRERQMHDTET
jgi:hypothetical protein